MQTAIAEPATLVGQLAQLLAKRTIDFEPEVREVEPYVSFREAEDELIRMVRINRKLLKGQVAFTGIALAPDRLDDEPTPKEAAREPAPFPPLMAGFPPPDARIVRGENSCALITASGKEVLPQLMHDAWDEDGFSCPFQLYEGIGIYGFHVRRNGAVCGEDGICTELYDAAGNYVGVIYHSPDPVFSVDMLQRFGLIASGTQQQYLYSIPERMHLGLPLPFAGLHWDDSVRIASDAIVDDRLAIVFEYTRAVDGKREDALFYIDTGRFEIDWEGAQGAPQLLPDPDLAHNDEIYAAARFENLATGEIDKGSIGWRAGLDPWVLLQVYGKAEASAGGPSVQHAYDAAASKLARYGYAACLDQGSFPFRDTHCHAKRYKRLQDRRKLAITFAFAAVLLSLGIMIGIGLDN